MKGLKTLVIAGALLAAGAAQAQTRWQMPTPYPPQNFHTVNIVAFADQIRRETNGRLDITVHPGGTLLPLPQILRNVQTGDVQIGEILLAAFENEDPIFGADNVPFVVTGYDAAVRLMERQRPLLERRFQQRGIRLLYMVAWPPQGFYGPRALNTIEDLRGLSFRSYGPSAARFGQMVGANVTTIQAAELSQALGTGRVNSFISSPVTGVDARVWESPVRWYYDMQAWLPKDAILVNERAFQALDQATRDIVLRAAAAAQERGWAASRQANTDNVEALRRNGMNVNTPSAALMQGFQRIGRELANDWIQRAGQDGRDLMAPFMQ